MVDATRNARSDLARYRDTFPAWVADSSDRGLSNWIHDRLWAHLRRALADLDSVVLTDDGVIREIAIGIRYRARVKRHSVRDQIRSFPTKAALAFWAQSDALEGLEEISLGFGYRWDPDEREIGSTVVSLRDGLKADAIWVVEVDASAADDGGAEISWTPIDPVLPQIDLYDAIADDEEGAP